MYPGRVLPYQEVGGGGGVGDLYLASSLEAKFGARFSQVHQIRRKIWGVLLLQDAKIGKESQFWGHLGLYLKFKGQNLGYLSPIFLEAKIWGSDMNFRGKIWGQAPRPPYMEVPLWDNVPFCVHYIRFFGLYQVLQLALQFRQQSPINYLMLLLCYKLHQQMLQD